MNKIYFTYRQTYTDRGVKQDISFYNDKVFADFKEAGLTEMIDGERFIPSDRITKEIVPGVKSQRKAGVLRYNEALNIEALKASLLRTTGNFLTEIKTSEEIKIWIEENTELKETENGYLINEEDIENKARYLIID